MLLKTRKFKFTEIAGMIFKYLILTGLAFVILYPFLLKLEISLMHTDDLTNATVRFVPEHFTLENYKNAFLGLDYGKSFLKTAALVLSVSLVQVAFAMITAYGLASFRFKGVGIVFAAVLLTLIAPPTTILLPLYLQFQSFDILGIFKLITGETVNLLGKPFPLFLLAVTGMGLKNGLLIFIFRQFFLGFPKELEESASIDGAGVFRTFISVIVPSAKPMMITCFLFSLVWQWTDSYYTSLFMPNNELLSRNLEKLTAAVSENQISMSQYQSSLINNAGIVLYILPILIMFSKGIL